MKKLKIAQIGIGHDHAPMIFQSLKKQTDKYEVVGYALPENEAIDYADKLGCFDGVRRFSVEEICNNPEIDAVTIETEEKNLLQYALIAAQAGKHIHLDKPAGMDLTLFERLLKTVRNNRLTLHLGYMYRYNPEVVRAVEMARSGELGEIYSIEAHMSGIYPSTVQKREWLKQFPGGMMFFLGCHLLDIILRFQGMPQNIIPLHKCTGIGGVSSQDFGMAVLEYKNGNSFVKSCAAEIGGFGRRQIVICGSKKTIEIKPTEFCVGEYLRTGVTEYIGDDKLTRTSVDFDRYDSMTSAFYTYVCGEKENPFTLEYEYQLQKIVLAACGVACDWKSEKCF